MPGELDAATGEAVLAALRAARGDDGLVFAKPPIRVPGGYSSQIFELRVASGGEGPPEVLVLRVGADPRAAAREITVQQAVSAQGFLAPPVVTHRADGGTPFVVMERMRGRPALDMDDRLGLPAALRRIPPLLGNAMALLHTLDPGPVRDRLRGAGVEDGDLGVDAVLARIRRQLARLADVPTMAVLDRLEARRPPPAPDVVCHADLHALNVLVEEDEVTAVLDWELATVADPHFDTARTVTILRAAPGEMSGLARRAVQALGGRMAARFLDAYGARHRIDRDALAWYEALHCLRTLVMIDAAPVGEAGVAASVVDAWAPCAPSLRRLFETSSGIDLP